MIGLIKYDLLKYVDFTDVQHDIKRPFLWNGRLVLCLLSYKSLSAEV